METLSFPMIQEANLASTTTNPKSTGLALGLTALPARFPAHIDSELAWTGSKFTDETQYVYHLTPAHVAEIQAALEHFKGLGLDGDLVKPKTFPLPTLGPALEKISRDVHEGKGFGVIRGIHPRDYSVEDLTTIWLGVNSYVADQQGRQDKRGNMLVHIVADNSSKEVAEHHRHSTQAITHHNEETGDVIAWLTRSSASEGGKCIISSVYTVYNVLAATRPDLVRVLARSDWPFAFPKFNCRPVVFYEDSKLIMNFGRTHLLGNEAHPRPAHLPSLKPGQLEALDAIDSLAKACELEIKTQPGDMHFVNNLAVFHRREGFVNGQAPEQNRHLVRMRLRSSQRGWAIPDPLRPDWERAFGETGPRHWHLEPMPRFYFPLRRHPF